MISKDNFNQIGKAIIEYNKLEGRTYLVLFKVNARQKSKAVEISILKENFWHLVGCRLDKNLASEQKQKMYEDCVEGKDVSDFLTYTRKPQDVVKKVNVIIKTFNFVSNAKVMRVCNTDNVPEATMFKIGVGSEIGIIGYKYVKKTMFPITAQQKSIFEVDRNANEKIFMVISKPYRNCKYNRLDYVISDKIFPEIINELPEDIQTVEDLFPET